MTPSAEEQWPSVHTNTKNIKIKPGPKQRHRSSKREPSGVPSGPQESFQATWGYAANAVYAGRAPDLGWSRAAGRRAGRTNPAAPETLIHSAAAGPPVPATYLPTRYLMESILESSLSLNQRDILIRACRGHREGVWAGWCWSLRNGWMHRWREGNRVELFWKTVWQFLKMVNIQFPRDPAGPLLDTHSADRKRPVHTKPAQEHLQQNSSWQ